MRGPVKLTPVGLRRRIRSGNQRHDDYRSRPLGLAELCRLAGLEAALGKNAASPLLQAATEVRAIVALFLRTLTVLGRLDPRQMQRVEESVWEQTEPCQDPLSTMPSMSASRVGF